MEGSSWVLERAKCSIPGIFQVLTQQVDSDVKHANDLGRRGVEFKIHTEVDNRLVIVRHRDMGGFVEAISIVFRLESDKVAVSRATNLGPTPLFFGTPDFNPDGECRLQVDGKPLTLWQFSRRALEDLFFGF